MAVVRAAGNNKPDKIVEVVAGCILVGCILVVAAEVGKIAVGIEADNLFGHMIAGTVEAGLECPTVQEEDLEEAVITKEMEKEKGKEEEGRRTFFSFLFSYFFWLPFHIIKSKNRIKSKFNSI